MINTTYYANVTPSHPRSDPAGLFRRIHTEPLPIDESLHRDLRWHRTEALYLNQLGYADFDYVEITESEAEIIIDRWTQKWR